MGDEGYKTNETSEEGAQNYIDFYVEKAMAFGGLAHTSRGALHIRQWEGGADYGAAACVPAI